MTGVRRPNALCRLTSFELVRGSAVIGSSFSSKTRSGVVDLDGDDPAGVAEPDLDALPDDLGGAAAGGPTLHPG